MSPVAEIASSTPTVFVGNLHTNTGVKMNTTSFRIQEAIGLQQNDTSPPIYGLRKIQSESKCKENFARAL